MQTDLLKHEVEDLVSAEDQIIEAMPAMIDKASNTTLKKSLREHLKVTQAQRKRLDEVQKLLNGNNSSNGNEEKKGFLSNLFGGSGKHECKGMKGLIDEGERVMGEDMEQTVLDAAIIACAQKIEHYEICGYGTARAYAAELKNPKVAKLLQQTLNEEYEADKLLTKLALGSVNEEADGKGNTGKGSSRGRSGGNKGGSSNTSGGAKNPKGGNSKSSPAKGTGVPKSSVRKSSGSSSRSRGTSSRSKANGTASKSATSRSGKTATKSKARR